MTNFFKKIFLIFLPILLFNCSALVLENRSIFNPETEKTKKILIIVEKSISSYIDGSINTYINDLKDQNITAYKYIWTGGTVKDLKNVINTNYNENKINGAFLIGNLPSVWFEMYAFTHDEEFPCDLYFMDFQADWIDSNHNNIYDSHGKLNLVVYTSRLIGTIDEINKYFTKDHKYRLGTLSNNEGAYIFKDDDWAAFNTNYAFGLENIYNNVTIRENINDTNKSTYLTDMTLTSPEYVYQWIHANPPNLAIKNTGVFQWLNINEFQSYNFKGVFYNLFDCSASRFTENNIAMYYLTKTDYGLATLGSTKIGGNHTPVLFNSVLAQKGTWGDAYKFWYNNFGFKDDAWFLGMMILGDPTLTLNVKEQVYQIVDFQTKGEPSYQELSKMNSIYSNLATDLQVENYSTYINKNQ
jgi:hypothetical protein